MPATLQVLYAAPPGTPTCHPCVDCGLKTGNFCDGGESVGHDRCFASKRLAKDYPASAGYAGMRTPLCSFCETCFGFCRFCRGVQGCTPPTRDSHWSKLPPSHSREFTASVFKRMAEYERAIKESYWSAPLILLDCAVEAQISPAQLDEIVTAIGGENIDDMLDLLPIDFDPPLCSPLLQRRIMEFQKILFLGHLQQKWRVSVTLTNLTGKIWLNADVSFLSSLAHVVFDAAKEVPCICYDNEVLPYWRRLCSLPALRMANAVTCT